jgi:hypothetical protein
VVADEAEELGTLLGAVAEDVMAFRDRVEPSEPSSMRRSPLSVVLGIAQWRGLPSKVVIVTAR